MKRIIILVFLSLIIFKSNAQIATADAAAAGLLAASNTTLTTLETINKKVQKALENASWAKNLKSMKQLYVLIESTTCTHQNLAQTMRTSGGYKDCNISFQYNMQLQNLNGALDMISIIITTGMSMSSGERLMVMTDAMTNFKKAHTEMANLKSMLEGRETQIKQVKIQNEEINKLYGKKTRF